MAARRLALCTALLVVVWLQIEPGARSPARLYFAQVKRSLARQAHLAVIVAAIDVTPHPAGREFDAFERFRCLLLVHWRTFELGHAFGHLNARHVLQLEGSRSAERLVELLDGGRLASRLPI